MIAASRLFLLVAGIASVSAAADHDALIEEGNRLRWIASLLVFTLFWLVMVVAMMLPSDLPIL